MTPLPPLLLPNTFRLEFEDRATFLKNPLQNLAPAGQLQRGVEEKELCSSSDAEEAGEVMGRVNDAQRAGVPCAHECAK